MVLSVDRLESANTRQGSLLKKLEKDITNNTEQSVKFVKPPGQRPQNENDFKKNGTVVAIPSDTILNGKPLPVPVNVSAPIHVPVPVTASVPAHIPLPRISVPSPVSSGRAQAKVGPPSSNKISTKIVPGYPIPANKPDLTITSDDRTTPQSVPIETGEKSLLTVVPPDQVDIEFATNTPVTDIPSEILENGFGSVSSGNKGLPTDIPSELIEKAFSISSGIKTVTTRKPSISARRTATPAGRPTASPEKTSLPTDIPQDLLEKAFSRSQTGENAIRTNISPQSVENGYGPGSSVTDLPPEVIESALKKTTQKPFIGTNIPSEEIGKATGSAASGIPVESWKTTHGRTTTEGEPAPYEPSLGTDIPSEILESALGKGSAASGSPSSINGKPSVVANKPTGYTGKPPKSFSKGTAVTTTEHPSEAVENGYVQKAIVTDIPTELVETVLASKSNGVVTDIPSEAIESAFQQNVSYKTVTDVPTNTTGTGTGRTAENKLIVTDIPSEFIENSLSSRTSELKRQSTTTQSITDENSLAVAGQTVDQVNPVNPYQVPTAKQTDYPAESATSKFPSLHVEGRVSISTTVGSKTSVTNSRIRTGNKFPTSSNPKIVTDIPKELLSFIFGQMNNRNMIKTTTQANSRPRENGNKVSQKVSQGSFEATTSVASTVRCSSDLETDLPPVLPLEPKDLTENANNTNIRNTGCASQTDIAVVFPLDNTEPPQPTDNENEIKQFNTEQPAGSPLSQTTKVAQPPAENNGYGVNVWQQPSLTTSSPAGRTRGQTATNRIQPASRSTAGQLKSTKPAVGIPVINPLLRQNKTLPPNFSQTQGNTAGYRNGQEAVTAVPNAILLQTTNIPTAVPSFARTEETQETVASENGATSIQPAETFSEITKEVTPATAVEDRSTSETEALPIVEASSTISNEPNSYGGQINDKGNLNY